jgi:hypothetical protein
MNLALFSWQMNLALFSRTVSSRAARRRRLLPARKKPLLSRPKSMNIAVRNARDGVGSGTAFDTLTARWNMPLWSKVLLITTGVLIALFLLDRLGLWMETRGWIYWRKVKPKGGGLAAGLSAFRELVEPQVRHVAEDRERRKIEIHRDDRSGSR